MFQLSQAWEILTPSLFPDQPALHARARGQLHGAPKRVLVKGTSTSAGMATASDGGGSLDEWLLLCWGSQAIPRVPKLLDDQGRGWNLPLKAFVVLALAAGRSDGAPSPRMFTAPLFYQRFELILNFPLSPLPAQEGKEWRGDINAVLLVKILGPEAENQE